MKRTGKSGRHGAQQFLSVVGSEPIRKGEPWRLKQHQQFARATADLLIGLRLMLVMVRYSYGDHPAAAALTRVYEDIIEIRRLMNAQLSHDRPGDANRKVYFQDAATTITDGDPPGKAA